MARLAGGVVGWCLASTLARAAPRSASGGAMFLDGKWRFTAVTDRLVRIEYSESQVFVDEPTFAFVRSEPRGAWQSTTTGEWSELNTSEVSVRYQSGSAPASKSVTVVSRSQPDKYHWAWGDDPADGNLRGTARTLDGFVETLDLNCHHKVSGASANSEQHCAWGLVSKDGWSVVNETGAPVLRGSWIAPSSNSTDVFVFMHGLDYTGALKDFFYAAGPPALPPRYAFGTMYTRWYDFDSQNALDRVDEFEDHGMPLDAWIFDMNWHHYGPWGSFSWNRNSFPDLESMLEQFQRRGLFIGANMHEASGFATDEDKYQELCQNLSIAPGEAIPFDLYNETYAMAQEMIAVSAVETNGAKQGIDFSWIDYQQGEKETLGNITVPGLNPTIVLNKLRSDGQLHHQGENFRSMILSRWGGLGNHRYPVGFSGDQLHTWKGLAFLPYFTSTAANVAFNFWSHDIMGGSQSVAGAVNDWELAVRWTQVGAWSPILRYHDKGEGVGDCAITDTCARAVPWQLPFPFFKALRDTARERDMLVPYIYTAAASTPATGEALVRPMYYENPEDANLYGLHQQYLFGPDMIISPITKASGADGFELAIGAVEWSVHAPAGDAWVDRNNGDFSSSGEKVVACYGIGDVPGLVRQGAVIPRRPLAPRESMLGRARKPLSSIEFRIFPAQAFYTGGDFSRNGSVVDDDGLTLAYQEQKRSVTTLAYSFHEGTFQISVKQEGDFDGRPARVNLRISFLQLPPMKVVSCTGIEPNELSIEYDARLLGPALVAHNVDLTGKVTFVLAWEEAYGAAALSHFPGLLGRARRARYVKDALAVYVVESYKATNLTSMVLAAAHMSPSFAAGMGDLWTDAVNQTMSMLKSGRIFEKDPRRYTFISQLLTGHTPSLGQPASGSLPDGEGAATIFT